MSWAIAVGEEPERVHPRRRARAPVPGPAPRAPRRRRVAWVSGAATAAVLGLLDGRGGPSYAATPAARGPVYARPHAAPERTGRSRLHRQRRPDADRQVRRGAVGRARGRARRGRDPAAVERSGLPADARIDEVIMGQVLQAGAGQAPARQALLRAGLADTTPATTINRVCGSGLKSIMFAAAGIRAGDGDVCVAGGMESMNQAPFLLRKARFGYRLGNGDARGRDGARRAVVQRSRTATWAPTPSASRSRTSVSREDQDAFALASHQRAVAAIDAGRFDAEMAPVTVRDAKGRETVVDTSTRARAGTRRAEALARLEPAFDLPDGEDRGSATDGTVTAGNAPGHHRRRGRDGRRLGARRGEARAQAPRPDRRLRPGRGRAQVAVPRARSRACAASRRGPGCRSTPST